jgi:hypothetical protein
LPTIKDAVTLNWITVFDSLSVFKYTINFFKNFSRGFEPLYVISERRRQVLRRASKAFRERNKEKIRESKLAYNKKHNYNCVYYQKHKDVKKVDYHRNKEKLERQDEDALKFDATQNILKRKHNDACNEDKTKKSRKTKDIENVEHSNHNVFECDDTEYLQKIFSRIDKKFCKATTVEDETTHQPNPNVQQSNICVVCDRLIIGMEDVKKISKDHLMNNKNCLSVSQYEEHFSLALKSDLVEQYQVEDSDLHGLLLSPRAQCFCEGKHYICCTSCYSSLMKSKNDELCNPPKFSIANGFAIGHIPYVLKFKNKLGELQEKPIDPEKALDDIFSAAISPVRPFGYVHAYTGGSQKCITGHFSFFSVDQSHVGGVLNKYRNIKNVAKNIFIVLCGRMTPDQKRIIKSKVGINLNTNPNIHFNS